MPPTLGSKNCFKWYCDSSDNQQVLINSWAKREKNAHKNHPEERCICGGYGRQVEFKVGSYRGALGAKTCFNIYKIFSYFISSYFINFDFKAHFLGVVGINI